MAKIQGSIYNFYNIGRDPQTFGVLKGLHKVGKQAVIGVLQPCYVIPHSDVFLFKERQTIPTQRHKYAVAFDR